MQTIELTYKEALAKFHNRYRIYELNAETYPHGNVMQWYYHGRCDEIVNTLAYLFNKNISEVLEDFNEING